MALDDDEITDDIVESHPFGDKVRQHLSRRNGLTQSKLADGIMQHPRIISDMLRGRRLTGTLARDRVLRIIGWLHLQIVLQTRAEADALLEAAGMAGLRIEASGERERKLIELLPAPPATASATAEPQPVAGSHPGKINNSIRSSRSLSRETVFSGAGSAPSRPDLFVGREDDMQRLKQRLGIGTDGLASLQVLTAMRGWPGVGKTTVAAALAHDHEIQEKFPDGVLWASLGQRPSLFSELLAWGNALGVPLPDVHTIEEASKRLTALLRNQRVLLIVDDVWQPEHIAPFRIGGSECTLLVTTRLPEVAQAITGPSGVYVLGVLSAEKALDLLRLIAPTVVAENLQASQELVDDLEGLPLAIQVAGRLLNVEASYGFGVTELLAEIRSGAKLIEAQAPLDQTELSRETIPSVAALLEKSTARLDPHLLDCFAYLGAFAPKPATFNAAALKSVWQVDDPQPLIRALVNRGLLEPSDAQRYWMHALLVVHARSFLTA